MKLSVIKKLIKEEFLREIKVDKRRITISPSIINDKDPIVQGELEALKGIYNTTIAKAEQQGLDYPFKASIEYAKDVSWMQGHTDGSHGRIVMIFSKGSAKLGIMTFDNSRWDETVPNYVPGSGYEIMLGANTKKGLDIFWHNGSVGYMKSDVALEGIFAWMANI